MLYEWKIKLKRFIKYVLVFIFGNNIVLSSHFGIVNFETIISNVDNEDEIWKENAFDVFSFAWKSYRI